MATTAEPPPPTREVTVLPVRAEYDEIRRTLEVEASAFHADPFVAFCFGEAAGPTAPNDETIHKYMAQIADPDQKFICHKAVDADHPDTILGVAWWYFAPDPHAETVDSVMGPMPPNAHHACLDASIGALRRWRLQYFKNLGQPYAHMIMLAVVPGHQRRGVGTALLRAGLAAVDRQRLTTYISASPAGLGLYKKLGWVEEFTNTVNLRDFGGDDYAATTVALIRPPAPGATEPEDAGADGS